ncbi:DUF411 domain-containing protein [Falsiroseomonas oryzae]|uniref:DUF411 domain-containing protein n=1 Tax=Falsiroseomonas oryzae TaxID=2766473 RepID=UPI0022EB5076|nr:DUF411 domain-containing protein [Roseomonas sp. MO-31]
MMRRDLLATTLLTAAGPALAQRGERVEVWLDPNCGCGPPWIAHLRAAGFAAEDRVVAFVATFRRMLGPPADLLSCHAARVASLGLEGHAPAQANRRLLADRPAGIVGLAVSAMPLGSPGMEVPGRQPDIYDAIAWRTDGTHEPFMRFVGAQPA